MNQNTMRRGVDYIGVGVGAVILDDTGRLFLALRGPAASERARPVGIPPAAAWSSASAWPMPCAAR
ncbi:MAG: hypothetical protein IPM84_08305 [Anaerolineae bacterium]|nr:hypothetical protein [Anaerolineae bacterium]